MRGGPEEEARLCGRRVVWRRTGRLGPSRPSRPAGPAWPQVGSGSGRCRSPAGLARSSPAIRPASFVGASEDENVSRFAAGGAVGLARGPHHRARPTNHGRSTMISCGSQCNTDSYANAAEALRQVDRRIPALISARRRANGHQSDHSPPTGVAAFRCSRGRSGAGSFADVRCRHRACHGGDLPTGHCRRSWSASCIGRGFRSPEAAGCPWTAARRHEFARCVQQNLINIHEPSICGHAAEL